MRKTVLYGFTFCLILIGSLIGNTVSADEKQRDDYTFGEIEQILINYLDENEYNLEIGTPEFNEFVINQMNTDADQKLANLEEYHLICAYFAEYLHLLSVYETGLMEEYSVSGESLNSTNSGETILEVVGETFNVESLKDIKLGEVKEKIMLEERANKSNEGNINMKATNTLNLTNARAYAKKHYSSYNPLYPNYTNDCTNFVSQIIQAGGRRQVSLLTTSSLISDTKYWFIKRRPDNTFSRSSSWSVVTDLYSHLVLTQGGYTSTSKTNIISNAKSGDVIQFKKAGADRYSHAMWIYEKTSSDLKLSGHTSDYWDRSFNAITGYDSYRIVKM